IVEAGIEQLLLKWPITPTTPSFTNLLATATACFGSCWSSPQTISSCLPRTPPLVFHSSTAMMTPFLSSCPNAPWSPVSGPATPSLIVLAAWARVSARTTIAAIGVNQTLPRRIVSSSLNPHALSLELLKRLPGPESVCACIKEQRRLHYKGSGKDPSTTFSSDHAPPSASRIASRNPLVAKATFSSPTKAEITTTPATPALITKLIF